MNSSDTTTVNTSIDFLSLLQVAFIVLKLCHAIEWSWFWVLSPIWISVGIVLLAIIILVFGSGGLKK